MELIWMRGSLTLHRNHEVLQAFLSLIWMRGSLTLHRNHEVLQAFFVLNNINFWVLSLEHPIGSENPLKTENGLSDPNNEVVFKTRVQVFYFHSELH